MALLERLVRRARLRGAHLHRPRLRGRRRTAAPPARRSSTPTRFEINDYQHLAGQLADDADLNPSRQARRRSTRSASSPPAAPTAAASPGSRSPTRPGRARPASHAARGGAPKYGWTNLVEALVPNGAHLRDSLPSTDPDSVRRGRSGSRSARSSPRSSPAARPACHPGRATPRSPPRSTRASPASIAADPFERTPLRCHAARPRCPSSSTTARRTTRTTSSTACRSDQRPASPSSARARSPTRCSRRRSTGGWWSGSSTVVPGYPVQEYYGDYNHFVQNKAQGVGRPVRRRPHVCTLRRLPARKPQRRAGGPRAHRGDHAAQPLHRPLRQAARATPIEPAPDFDVTASLQVCPQNAESAFPPPSRASASRLERFAELAPHISEARRQARSRRPRTSRCPTCTPSTPTRSPTPLTNRARCPVESALGGAGRGDLRLRPSRPMRYDDRARRE